MVNTYNAKAFAKQNKAAPFAPHTIQRRDPQPNDVQIDILFCGVCHSDLHYARDEWHSVMPARYPVVPGHEIIGRVRRVGNQVSRYQAGDIVGVGCMVDGDSACPHCRAGLEQFSPTQVLTYGSVDKYLGGGTLGGYSESIVVNERYVLRIPANLDLAATAPLLCAGITTYSPLRHWKVGPGMKVGIVGLGGLGHMGVKFARAFGAHVVVFTTSPNKVADAKRLGAHEVVVSSDTAQMAQHARSFQFILDAVSADHDINAYINLLAVDGNITLVGAPEKPLQVSAFSLIMGRRSLSGSPIGSIAETQEMLDFCGQHNITADIELISMQQINEAHERMSRGEVKYRFSIDMATLQTP